MRMELAVEQYGCMVIVHKESTTQFPLNESTIFGTDWESLSEIIIDVGNTVMIVSTLG